MNDNFIQSFQLEASRIRGRIVRFGSVLDNLLNAHAYPDDVSHLTGEMLVLCSLLSSMLKYEGVFTLQVQGDGPVNMLVSDMTSAGHVRACASFHESRLPQMPLIGGRAALLGKGHMAFTVDQGESTERYQGIVELKGDTLLGSVQHYFMQSEQISTGMVLAVGRSGGAWRGCGIMVQQMPEEAAAYNADKSNVDEDDWRRTMILLGSAKEEELLSPAIGAEEMLFRLFHEEGVRVYDPAPLANICRCSPERVENILSSMSEEDIKDVTVDGKVYMTCEFCSRHYEFEPDHFRKGNSQ